MKQLRIIAMTMVGLGLTGCGAAMSLGPRVPTAAPAVAPLCTANNLSAQGGREGESMGAHVDILLRNTGAAACVLRGAPVAARLFRRDGSALPTTLATDPSNLVNKAVLLKQHGQNVADLVLYWGNWCGPAPGPLQIQVTLPDGRGTVAGALNGPPDYDYVPQCLQPTQPSTLQIVAAYSAGR